MSRQRSKTSQFNYSLIAMELLQALVNTENQETFLAAWSRFFLSLQLAKTVGEVVSEETASEIINAGGTWGGNGWNTGKASKTLVDMVNVPLVSSNFSEYRNAWLYGLAVVRGIDVGVIRQGGASRFWDSTAPTR